MFKELYLSFLEVGLQESRRVAPAIESTRGWMARRVIIVAFWGRFLLFILCEMEEPQSCSLLMIGESSHLIFKTGLITVISSCFKATNNHFILGRFEPRVTLVTCSYFPWIGGTRGFKTAPQCRGDWCSEWKEPEIFGRSFRYSLSDDVGIIL